MAILTPGRPLLEGLRLVGYPDFGLFVAKSSRLYAASGAVPSGSSVTAAMTTTTSSRSSCQWTASYLIRDPGTYLYMLLPEGGNAYRSVRAHFAPQLVGA